MKKDLGGRPLKYKQCGALYSVMSLRMPPKYVRILGKVSGDKEIAMADLLRKVIFEYIDKHPDCAPFRKSNRRSTHKRKQGVC